MGMKQLKQLSPKEQFYFKCLDKKIKDAQEKDDPIKVCLLRFERQNKAKELGVTL